MANSSVVKIPEVKLSSSSTSGHHRNMPVIGMGSAADNLDGNNLKLAVLEAIKVGYRHFDTASVYGSEKALGDAIAEALRIGLVTCREELFIASKLWCTEAHSHLVKPALQKSLSSLQMAYLDLYLIHWPISAKPVEKHIYPIPEEELQPMNYKAVWEAMEECQRLGLTKSIGVSNFSCKKLETILSFATIPPSVNQVEMNPVWQQRKLVEFGKANGIVITAFSPLGGIGSSWGTNRVMDNETLNHIAKAHGKTVAQVCLRWIIEQGATAIAKSFNRERMMQNLEIFDWALTDDDRAKINQIPQLRLMPKEEFISPHGPFKTLEELWDDES
ncbi:hypothetical protein LWI28_003382 [Acer negundo]|uniref:NADP-dependent oxidoreductase domain-containing protein n=1 Tax=Acer negundo TaxID=4023 RepID=A0AAD5NMP9_ACENE|nr:hypothetical protein LWI28_003382 [Acer negundo]KAK4842421.1 hypothetical protein QYF36_021292 [Acer negundo]